MFSRRGNIYVSMARGAVHAIQHVYPSGRDRLGIETNFLDTYNARSFSPVGGGK